MKKALRQKLLVKRLTAWFQNLSLNSKIVLLVCLAEFLPVGITLVIFLTTLQNSSEEQQIYALNQGFSQVSQTVGDKLSRVHNISTLLAVNDMINLSLKLSGEEESIAQQLANFENINSYTYGMEMAFESSNILFYVNDGFPVVNDAGGRYRSIETAEETQWYADLEANNGRPTWVSFHEDIYDQGREYVAITRKLWDQNDYSKDIGVLAVLLERKYLEDMLIDSARQQIMYLETAEGSLLASNVPQEELIRLPLEYRALSDREFREATLAEGRYLVRSQLIDKTNTYLVSMLPYQVMKKEIMSVNIRMSLLYLLVCAGILLVLIPLTRSVTNRIQLVKNQMMQVQQGIIRKIDMEQNYADEIGQLIVRYNEMVDKVEELMKEQYALGQEKTGAELKALQSQINPHFLYNTLDMINWMAQKNETDNIRNVVQAMSRFYRLTLSKGHDIVTIADEVGMCDAYMEIQKRRYKGRIHYEVEDDILGYLIPKITLQPFLENAIIHGINEKEDARGMVVLNGWMEDGRITLSVTDDGTGMTKDNRKKSSSGSHYGMENIARRLKLFYGEEIPVLVESSLGVGTCIIINIPMRRKEDYEGRGEWE